MVEPFLQPVDAKARRLAKTLLRTARWGALACLEPETEIPLASRVSVAPAMDGAPVMLISQLSSHFAALEADPRCSLLLGEPGRGDPLAHPRITIIATARRLGDDLGRSQLRHRFLSRHPKAALYIDFADFALWRLEPQRAALNGGFGKAFALTATDLTTDLTACGELQAQEASAVDHMNDDHRDALAAYATGLLKQPPGDWRLASLDPEGLDLVLGDRLARLWFEPPLANSAELRPRLVDLARQARAAQGGNHSTS
ncbi:MAG: HugZ family protein [Candidatus Competibacterales bacterium]